MVKTGDDIGYGFFSAIYSIKFGLCFTHYCCIHLIILIFVAANIDCFHGFNRSVVVIFTVILIVSIPLPWQDILISIKGIFLYFLTDISVHALLLHVNKYII